MTTYETNAGCSGCLAALAIMIIAAAVVTFVALAFGERTVMAVVDVARRVVVSLFPRMPELAVDSVVTRVAAVRLRASSPLTRRLEFAELRHRGPPALPFA